MLSEEQLLSVIAEKGSELKKQFGGTSRRTVEIPDYTCVYKKSIEQRDRIRVHAELDVFPAELFRNRAPNQTDIEHEYLKANYKSATLPVWSKFQSMLSRIWGDQNWKIDYKKDDQAKAYLEEEYPVYGSLEAYFKDVVTTVKELDNNGVIALTIHNLPWVPVYTPEGPVLPPIDDRKYISPMVHYYACEAVIGFEESSMAIVLTDEKSEVLSGNKTEMTGLVFDIYDDMNIYRAYQYGKKSDFLFAHILYYPHNLTYLPVKKLNGKAKQEGLDVFYQSAFVAAIDSLDKALLDDSYLSASKAKCAFPQGWELASECDYVEPMSGNRCSGGYIMGIGPDGADGICPSCAGTTKKRPGILGIRQINISEFNGGSIPNGPTFGFVSPETTTLEFLSAQVDLNIQKGASILNIDISNSFAKGSDTALGKQIDREEQFSFIKRISDQIFQLFEFSSKMLVQVRFGIDTQAPLIIAPKTFSLRNDADLTDEITEAKDAALPDLAMKRLMREYFSQRFGTDTEGQKAVDLIFYTDTLIGLSNDDILKKITVGTVAKWQDILHTSIESFIEEMIEKDPAFLDKDKNYQRTALYELAKQVEASINPAKVNVDSVLSKANA